MERLDTRGSENKSNKSLTLPSFAKINWTLEIQGRRSDGYHELRTLLQTIDLGDELTFDTTTEGIEILCDHPEVPVDETNLVYRAARSFFEHTGIRPGIRIRIDKRLPVAAGIGGGSSNAAVTLLALQRLCGAHLPPRELISLGTTLGADVPFFFLGGTALGVGRGDEIYPMPEIHCDRLLLVNAGIGVSTRDVYGNLPSELTKPSPMTKIPLSFVAAYAALAQPDELPVLHNDLEPTVFARHSLLAEIKGEFASRQACGALMSGSGSTIFAIFDSEQARSTARRDFQKKGWWCEPARTLSRLEYQKLMAGQNA